MGRDDRVLGPADLGIYAPIKTAIRRRGGDDERRPAADEPGGDARRILDELLARGEINPEEYRHLLDVLSSDGHRTPVSSGMRHDRCAAAGISLDGESTMPPAPAPRREPREGTPRARRIT